MFPFTFGLIATSTPASTGYATGAIAMDGVNDYMEITSLLTGSTNGLEFTLSGWNRFNSTSGDNLLMTLVYNRFGNFYIQKTTTNRLQVFGYDPPGSSVAFSITSTGTFTSTSGWIHWAVSRNSTTLQLYINGVNTASSTTNTSTNLTMMESTRWTIGAGSLSGPNKSYADFADYICNFSTRIDLSVAANLEKFRSTAGKPVDMGANGNTPFTAAPIWFYKMAAGSSGSTFAVDRSTRSNNMTVTGAFGESTTSPTD